MYWYAVGECELTPIDTCLKEKVFKILDKNHDLLPMQICKLLSIVYKKQGGTVRTYKCEWKCQFKKRLPLKCLKFHNVRGWIYALKGMDRDLALNCGWLSTESRSKMIIFKEKIGRLEWFPTNRINIWVKKPSTKGRVKQLLANAFFRTGLIFEYNIFESWIDHARLKGAHLVFDTGERLPYARIDLLKDSLGVIVKMGDITHPTGLEIEFAYPDFNEKNEIMFARMEKVMNKFSELLNPSVDPKNVKDKDDFMII